MEEFFYDYLKNYLTEHNDPRQNCEEFLRGRAMHAASVYKHESRTGSSSPSKVALEALLFGFLSDPAEEDVPNTEKQVFKFCDADMRYFQVIGTEGYQILVQDNSNEDAVPSIPHKADKAGNVWELDRCVGVIFNGTKEDLFVETTNDVAEVEPHFRRIGVVGYPDGNIDIGRRKQHVEILIPPVNPFETLNQMVGCKDIKQRLEEFKMLAEYNKACLSQSRDYPVMEIFLHSVFYGNPGTGKTTICRLYGALLKEAGLLSKGHVVVVDRNTLACDYFGETEMIVSQLLEKSRGGILMFDEAYLLEGSHRDDPNKMVLPILLSALADDKNKDFAVVLCGYKDKLDRMIEQNPGLYSRFVNRFEFKDYSLDELIEIGVRYLKTFGHSFSLDGLAAFRKELAVAMADSNAATWANARSVKNMIEHTYIQRAKRYGKDSTLDRLITEEDICQIPYERQHRIGF